MISDAVRRQLLRFCAGEGDAAAFEAWICADVDVEGQIGHGAYVDLISADYRGREAWGARDLCARLLEEHHPGLLPRYRATVILESMLTNNDALLVGLRKLVALRNGDTGFEFIPIEFVGFDSETDSIPTSERQHLWYPALLAEKLAAVRYFATIRKATKELLADLRKGLPGEMSP